MILCNAHPEKAAIRGLQKRSWIAALLLLLVVPAAAEESSRRSPVIWSVPGVALLPDDDHGRQVRRGRELITATYAHVGPEVADPAKRYAGNNLACSNCHLEAGTKKFGLPIFGLYWDFPQYSPRSGKDVSIADRLNSCMTRSMNGKPLPIDSPEMHALVAYIKFLSSGLSPGEQLQGHGSGRMPELDRAADPERGRAVYVRACLNCHNGDGSGIARSPAAMMLGYAVPPLWGSGSFNDGAGMARLGTLANFIHSNMPHGADYLNPMLTVEEAWDVAAYVESQPRPHKSGLEHDFPVVLDKPVDTPYGPYADHFSEVQHKYGPFAPIRAALAHLRARKENTHKGPR